MLRPLAVCLAFLTLAPGGLSAQDGVRLVLQGGFLAPDEFGEVPVVIDFVDPIPADEYHVDRVAERGLAGSLGLVLPFSGDVSLEAAWEIAAFDTGERTTIRGDEGPLDENAEHRVHVYRAGLRYTAPLETTIRPHVSASLGGMTTLSEYENPRGRAGRDFTETQLVASLGAGFTAPLHGGVRLRFDVRDLIQFCGESEPPCEEEGALHHLGAFGGVEIGL